MHANYFFTLCILKCVRCGGKRRERHAPFTNTHIYMYISLDKCQAAAHWEPQVVTGANLKFSQQHSKYEIAHAQIIEKQKPVKCIFVTLM